jgi:hypothetical protein
MGIKDQALLKQRQITFGVILPYVWIIVFLGLILLSFASRKISYFIAAENLILLTFVFSPFIYAGGLIISLYTMLKSGLSKSALFAVGLNIALFVFWFLISKSFYIEFNMIN